MRWLNGIIDSMDMGLRILQGTVKDMEAMKYAVVHVSQRIGWDLANNHIYHLKINILTISKCSVQWHEVYSHCCVPISTIYLQNFLILQNCKFGPSEQ